MSAKTAPKNHVELQPAFGSLAGRNTKSPKSEIAISAKVPSSLFSSKIKIYFCLQSSKGRTVFSVCAPYHNEDWDENDEAHDADADDDY